MAILLTRAKVLFILFSLLTIHTNSIISNAITKIAIRAGIGMTGLKFLILFSL